MSTLHSIQILSSKLVDKQKWNDCLRESHNAIIYADYNYLHHLSDNWAGIVINDYEAIMPLPFRKKWGIRYGYDAPFIQQLGLFGNYDNAALADVVSVATQHLKYGDLFFNFGNHVTFFLPHVKQAANYFLSLHQPYKSIQAGYNNHLRSKLKQAASKELCFIVDNDMSATINLFQQLYSQRLLQIKNANFSKLKKAADYFFSVHQCFAALVSDAKNNVLARALFFKDEKRIYNILPSTTAEGRKQNAMHFLLDNIIRLYAESSFLLDFEGSDVPGIKAFYQSFGAVNQPYFHYHYNRLPFPLRLLKR